MSTHALRGTSAPSDAEREAHDKKRQDQAGLLASSPALTNSFFDVWPMKWPAKPLQENA